MYELVCMCLGLYSVRVKICMHTQFYLSSHCTKVDIYDKLIGHCSLMLDLFSHENSS